MLIFLRRQFTDYTQFANKWVKKYLYFFIHVPPEEGLERFGAYRAWAIELAAALREHGIRTFPEVPHIATFLAYAPGTAEQVNERVVALVEERGVVPCGLWSEADVPGWVQTELTCYEAAVTRDPGEVAAVVAEAVGAATFLP